MSDYFTWQVSKPDTVTHKRITFRYGWKLWRWPLVFRNRLWHRDMFTLWKAARKAAIASALRGDGAGK